MTTSIDWQQIEDWDRRYYLHNTASGREFSFLPVERVDGNYLTLADGTRLLDFQSQLISDSLGHRHPAIHNAIKAAMDRYGHVFFGMATDLRARAAKLVIEDILGAPASWAARVRFLTSGSEACENAIQIAKLYTGKPLIMTQAHSYHGLTTGPTLLRGYRGNLSSGDGGDFTTVQDVPGIPSAGYIPIPPPEHSDFQCSDCLPSLAATEQLIRACGAENIAAVITEPMFGAAGLFPHEAYYPGLHKLLRKYNILWIDDEVLCGFARLGEWFGYQLSDNIEPDIMVVGKGINGSSLPSGGVVLNEDIAATMENARWWSGSTWDAHPLICASIVGALEYMLEADILSVVKKRSVYLKESLDYIAQKHSCVGRISGAGLYQVVDLINKQGDPIVAEDRYSAFTGDISQNPNNLVASHCAANGVFLGGFVPNSIKCGPPFTIEESEIDTAMKVFSGALDVVEKVHH
ncbi:MAG: aspartate aminotransferase family protein [Proteobacteria bacterium]|nr:aspartate aminotransferase family protein [Pseudomonadota bacterium]